MRANTLYKHKKASNGSGRTAVIKHLLLPEEVAADLRLFKECYGVCLATEKDSDGNPVPIRVTLEQMIRRWMDNVGRFDPDVASRFASIKEAAAVDSQEKQVQERLFFSRNGERILATPGDLAPFFARIEGRNIGMQGMLSNGWTLVNGSGNELSMEEAKIIRNKLGKKQD